jgi:hypothetical protein
MRLKLRTYPTCEAAGRFPEPASDIVDNWNAAGSDTSMTGAEEPLRRPIADGAKPKACRTRKVFGTQRPKRLRGRRRRERTFSSW